MNDTTDDDRIDRLVLYYYNDGLTQDERREVAAQLDRDPGLRSAYEEMRATLDASGTLDGLRTTADRKARFAATVDSLAANRTQRESTSFRWMFMAAFAATLVVGIAIGLRLGNAPEPQAPFAEVPDETAAPYARRVTNHLRDSQQQLLSLSDQSEQQRLLLLRDIVTRNRSFVAKAEAQGDEQLARLLRAFEPVLLEIASGETRPEDQALLTSQLMFELNVVLTRYGSTASKESNST